MVQVMGPAGMSCLLQRTVVWQWPAVSLLVGGNDVHTRSQPLSIAVGDLLTGAAIDDCCVWQVCGCEVRKKLLEVRGDLPACNLLAPVVERNAGFGELHGF